MKTFLSLVILFVLADDGISQTNNANHSPKSGTKSSIVYIDLTIEQPNVTDCYTAVQDFDHENGWVGLYPNPNQGEFNLEIYRLKTGEQIAIHIYSPVGKEVYQSMEEATEENLLLNLKLEMLPKGIYYIHVVIESRRTTKKLTII